MELAGQRQTVVKKPYGARGQEQGVSRGRAKVNEASEMTLTENSEKIAKSLLDGILKGNAASAKLLFALAEGRIDCEDERTMQRLCSFAEKLASEPEWNDDEIEAAAEKGFDECEPGS